MISMQKDKFQLQAAYKRFLKREDLIWSTFQVLDDIITVDNIYKFVEPPRGPDVFTVNVESALNFGNRYWP